MKKEKTAPIINVVATLKSCLGDIIPDVKTLLKVCLLNFNSDYTLKLKKLF